MSVFRRLYNVAYGKVRAWQSDDPPMSARVEDEISRLRAQPTDTEPTRAPEARERVRDLDGADEDAPAPRTRRL